MKNIGLSIAAAAFVLLSTESFAASATTTTTTTSTAATVHCMGINSCKGQSACKTTTNSCKGQNSCKGKGWMPTASKDECTSKGGTVES